MKITGLFNTSETRIYIANIILGSSVTALALLGPSLIDSAFEANLFTIGILSFILLISLGGVFTAELIRLNKYGIQEKEDGPIATYATILAFLLLSGMNIYEILKNGFDVVSAVMTGALLVTSMFLLVKQLRKGFSA